MSEEMYACKFRGTQHSIQSLEVFAMKHGSNEFPEIRRAIKILADSKELWNPNEVPKQKAQTDIQTRI